MIPWLTEKLAFPPVEQALKVPPGLLAAGGDLSAERLLLAYRQGIFPWFSPGDPILWWATDPRMVLRPQDLHISHSLGKTLRQGRYHVRLNSAFRDVIAHCASRPRPGQNGTWITPEIQAAYLELHRLGFAHSVETWINGQLAGGLYGIALGKAFFGESMFALSPNASKIAFAHLCRYLHHRDFGIIDCQMETAHLASLGAAPVPRKEFSALLSDLIPLTAPLEPQLWPEDDARHLF